MAKLLTIHGGKPLTGEVTVRGAKNLVPKAMVAALLGNSPSVLRNIPEIKDVDVVSSSSRSTACPWSGTRRPGGSRWTRPG